MKILITGSSGFIGGHLVERLSNSGNEIFATGRSLTNRFDNYPNVKYLNLDLTQELPLFQEEVCIHCAGLADDNATAIDFELNNVIATRNLLNALPLCKLFIFISSSSVYNFSDGQLKKEEDAIQNSNLSAYGFSKFKAENFVIKSGIKSIYIIRPRAVYGFGDRVLLPRILKQIRFGHLIVPGKLEVMCSLTYIGNLADVVSKCLNIAGNGFNIYNIADAKPYLLREVFECISNKFISKPNLIEMPLMLVRFIVEVNRFVKSNSGINQQTLDYLTLPSVLDISKAEQGLNYQPEFTFFDFIKNAEKI